LCLFGILDKSFSEEGNTIKFVCISDLNLYPTPIQNPTQKHLLEKKYGLLIYESQAVFQDIIRYINQKLNIDFVVFAGNSISETPELNKLKRTENVWHLFLDMVSELKNPVFFVFGKNELNTQNKIELILALNTNGIETENTWWSHKIKTFLLIGLDSQLVFEKRPLSIVQLKWLLQTLEKNKDLITVIFIHKPLLDIIGKPVTNQNASEVINILKSNPQVKLVISGSELLTRIRLFNNVLFVTGSSPISYPATYNLVEISNLKIKVKALKIPLKGVIKKAQQYLIESDRAVTLFPDSLKNIKNYASGQNKDRDLEYQFPR